jgi:hypothetical protein
MGGGYGKVGGGFDSEGSGRQCLVGDRFSSLRHEDKQLGS